VLKDLYVTSGDLAFMHYVAILYPCHELQGLTKSPGDTENQGACQSADHSSFVLSQKSPHSLALFAGLQVEFESAMGVYYEASGHLKKFLFGFVSWSKIPSYY